MRSSEAEFDVYARWTAEAVRALGPAHAVPAGCRGSGSPAALAWLAEALDVSAGQPFLDVGAGVGGPAAWLDEHYRATVLCLEPMAGAVAACRSLFDIPAAVATAHRLPLSSDVISHLWALGVLSTTSDKPALLRELHRVLAPGGGLGLLVYAAQDDDPAGRFPAVDAVPQLLHGAGFHVVDTADASELPSAPQIWSDRAEAVETWIAQRHRHESAWRTADNAATEMARLLSTGAVRPLLLHARAR